MTASPADTRVAWVGTGVMGAPMCGHLIAAGYRVVVHSRTRARAADLEGAGARWADTPREAAAGADFAFAIVGYPADVHDVFLGANGLLAGAPAGAVLVDMTTSEPALAVEMAVEAKARGVAVLDAPVSGGDVGAREARLSIMVGGEAEAFSAVEPLFARLGATVEHQGPAGSGQHTKMVNQILIASTVVGVCEAMLYAKRAGLDPLHALVSVGGGAAGSWQVNQLAPRMVAGDFAPGFYVEHFIKDMNIALASARHYGLTLPGLALAERLYRKLESMGHGRSGTQALILALEDLAREP